MLQEEAWGTFRASNRQLEHFKKCFGLRQSRKVGEAGGIPVTTIKAWIERLPEIIQGPSADDTWNMDESGLFFKALPNTGLAKKLKSVKAVRNQKSEVLWHFFLSSSRFKVCKPIVIGIRKVSRCFRKSSNSSKPYGVQYFHSKKAWVTKKS